MVTPSSNPYKTPPETGDGSMPLVQPERWHGFKTGARSGTLWSLLVVIPAVPVLYVEMTIGHRFPRSSVDGVPQVAELSSVESAMPWLAAMGVALLAITLPWAITAGCVGCIRSGRKDIEN